MRPLINRSAWTLLLVTILGASCGAANQASFSLEAPTCTADRAACTKKCQPREQGGEDDRTSCDVLKVLAAEDYLANPDPTKASPTSLQQDMQVLCGQGISRACDVEQRLKPLAVDAEKKAGERNTAASTEAQAKGDFQSRLMTVRQSARGLLKDLNKGEWECTHEGVVDNCNSSAGRTAGAALKMAEDAERCGPRCSPKLQTAEEALNRARTLKDEEEARRKAENDGRAESAANAARWQSAKDSCKADVKACQAACTSNAAADECPALGYLYVAGDQRVSSAGPNPIKGRDLTKKACDAGSKFACAALPGFDDAVAHQEERKKAEASLPGLLAKCDKNKAAVAQIRAEVEAAKRRGDRERLAELSSKAQALSTEITEHGQAVNTAIALATGQEEPRYAQLIEQARRRCVP